MASVLVFVTVIENMSDSKMEETILKLDEYKQVKMKSKGVLNLPVASVRISVIWPPRKQKKKKTLISPPEKNKGNTRRGVLL